jgi:hypothetical protein
MDIKLNGKPAPGNSFLEDRRFDATMVAASEEAFTDNFTVHGIYFGEGDPEHGGQHWNFTRSLGDDDDGVCTLKEIQSITVYDGIVSFDMHRTALVCEFDTATAQHTGVRRLTIAYEVDDATWSDLVTQAKHVFSDRPYFQLA